MLRRAPGNPKAVPYRGLGFGLTQEVVFTLLSPDQRADGHQTVRKIIRIDTKSVRSAGRSTSGVKLLDLDSDDKVAAAVVIPPEESKTEQENGTLLQ
jgi:hypothetical protein